MFGGQMLLYVFFGILFMFVGIVSVVIVGLFCLIFVSPKTFLFTTRRGRYVALGAFFVGMICFACYLYEESKMTVFHTRLNNHGDVWIVQGEYTTIIECDKRIVWRKNDHFIKYYLNHNSPRLRNIGIKEDGDDIIISTNSRIIGKINTVSGLMLDTFRHTSGYYKFPGIYKADGDDPTKQEYPCRQEELTKGYSSYTEEFSQLFPMHKLSLLPSGGIQKDIIKFGDYDWFVLDVQEDKMLILSEHVIESRNYHSQYELITWSECDLRKYLNEEFFQTFSSEDRDRILDTKVVTNNNPWYDTDGGEETTDKIFLLSIEEVVHYFGDSGQLKNRSDKKVYFMRDQYNSSRIAFDKYDIASSWWLRSPGHPAHHYDARRPLGQTMDAAFVDIDGTVDLHGEQIFTCRNGIRPALWLKVQ